MSALWPLGHPEDIFGERCWRGLPCPCLGHQGQGRGGTEAGLDLCSETGNVREAPSSRGWQHPAVDHCFLEEESASYCSAKAQRSKVESPSDTAGTVPRLPSTEPGSNNLWPGRGCPLHPAEPRSSLPQPDSLG